MSNQQLNVIKRDGSKQPFDVNKITKRINYLSSDLNINVYDLVAQCTQLIRDEIHTREFDLLVSEESHSRIRYNLDYDILASRIRWNDLHKMTCNTFGEKLEILKDRLNQKYYNFAKSNLFIIEKEINYSKDYNIDYFGFMTLQRSYLLKYNGNIVERYQDLLMRVALYINMYDIKSAIKTYHLFSDNMYTHATSTLFNSGLSKSTLSSCFLLECGDSIESITDNWMKCGRISARCGGIAINFTRIREREREIKNNGGRSRGIIPFIKSLEGISNSIDQGGKRNSSIAISIDVWHPELYPFLELKTNTGDEEMKARGIFTALMFPDIFFKRLVKAIDGDDVQWSFFSPYDQPQLVDLYDQEFENEYIRLEREKKYTHQESIMKVWRVILKSLVETGNPYMLSKDSINRMSNQKNIGTITSSNLCNEIVQYHDENEVAVCNLCSISLPKMIKEGEFNFKRLKKLMKMVVHNLNRVIDIDEVPVKNNSLKQRPMGIGVQGLNDVFSILKYSWGSPEALNLDRLIFEHIYYYSLYYSCKLAKRYGPYEFFEGSPLSKGIFQFENYKTHNERNEPVITTLDFDSLRKDIMRYGVRNSLYVAIMPTASTAQIFGNTESIELITSNIYTRKVQSGDFTVINKHLYRDLNELGLWNQDLVNKIIEDDGSIQNINYIPDDIKKRYLTCWEIKQGVLLRHAIIRTPFVDQSQSFNIFYSPQRLNESRLTSYYIDAWKGGMKTLSYYVRTRAVEDAVKVTLDKEEKPKMKFRCTDEVCTSCSS